MFPGQATWITNNFMPIGSMYAIYANIWGTVYLIKIHSYYLGIIRLITLILNSNNLYFLYGFKQCIFK